MLAVCCFFFFFFKQKTAYEMRISDWSSDVCSSDLDAKRLSGTRLIAPSRTSWVPPNHSISALSMGVSIGPGLTEFTRTVGAISAASAIVSPTTPRSEEHTSELQSLMRISYAVFCLKKQNTHTRPHYSTQRLKHQ